MQPVSAQFRWMARPPWLKAGAIALCLAALAATQLALMGDDPSAPVARDVQAQGQGENSLQKASQPLKNQCPRGTLEDNGACLPVPETLSTR